MFAGIGSMHALVPPQMMLIDAVGEDAEAAGLAFDLTLNGFGGGRSLLRFAFCLRPHRHPVSHAP